MANFKPAFDVTMGHEGGYVNDPDDLGSETYRGISRKHNPDWAGWSTIDNFKQSNAFPNNINDAELATQVEEFYKARYWNPFRGDEINSAAIANELFDSSVNMGVTRAVQFLQESLNLLNRNGKSWAEIGEDGDFGKKTLKALNEALAKDETSLFSVMNILQGMHYIALMKRSPVQEKYARGWFKRVRTV
jgi:lysozyme family protein